MLHIKCTRSSCGKCFCVPNGTLYCPLCGATGHTIPVQCEFDSPSKDYVRLTDAETCGRRTNLAK